MRKNQRIAIFLIFPLICIITISHPVLASSDIDLNVGPYVDKIVYKVISNQDQRVLALQAGEIDLDTSLLDPANLPFLETNPDIDVYSALRNGYGHITINCRDYPLNISSLRRAFAFAFDKTQVTNEIMNGFSIEHDSLVPLANGWCVENDFDWHYYEARPDIGNQILDDLGFEINATTGFRLAPNGEPFDIEIAYSSSSPDIAGGVAQIGIDALHSLHIDANKTRYLEYGALDGHGKYDMVFYQTNFPDNDVEWLAYEYWSEYADVPYQNPTNFRNATYDSWRNQLLYGISYDEVYEAASEMQKILQYNVPRLVVHENTYVQAYRTNMFSGHVPDLGNYISGPWTMRKIHQRSGGFGSTVNVAIGQELHSFNIFVPNSLSSETIFSELWPSLYKYAPDATPYPYLATDMIVETHAINPAVPDGHTRFTIDIIQNATWTDGTPLTAEDVAFTFTYAFESGIYGNPAAAFLDDLVAAYAPSPLTVVIEYATESYWYFSNFAFDYVIPKHIFNDVDGIGYDGWNTWNPVFDPAEPYVTCGPFVLTDYNAGEYYEISAYTNFAFYPEEPPPPDPDYTPTSPTTNTQSHNNGNPLSPTTLASIAVSSVSSIIIIVMVREIMRHKAHK